MRNKRSYLMLGAVVALLAGALPARACSCFPRQDMREELNRSAGALIGTFLSQEPTEDGGTVHTMQVEEALKGELGDTVEVHSSGDHGMCGLHGSPGARVGILLTRDTQAGTWEANSCSVVPIEELREAAAPLPEPDGRGGARVLVGGSWGEVGHLALDGAGRTLGYGTGDHNVTDLVVCPNGRTFVEGYWDDGPVVALRRIRTNETLWERRLSPGRAGAEYPVELGCSGGRDPAILVATNRSATRNPAGRVLRLREATDRVLYDGGLFDAAFGAPGAAYLQRGARGREVVELRFGSGKTQTLGWTPAGPTEPALSPDSRRLAAFAEGTVFVFDLTRGGRVDRQVGIDSFGDVAWIDNGRLGFFPGCGPHRRVQLFDARLRKVRHLDAGWCADEVAVSGRAIYGLSEGELRRVALPDGRGGGAVELVRAFPSPFVTQLAAVPGLPETTGRPPDLRRLVRVGEQAEPEALRGGFRAPEIALLGDSTPLSPRPMPQ